MSFRFCPQCGRAALVDDVASGGKRCKICKRPFFIQDLNATPAVASGARVASHIVTKPRDEKSAASKPAAKPQTGQAGSDKPMSPLGGSNP